MGDCPHEYMVEHHRQPRKGWFFQKCVRCGVAVATGPQGNTDADSFAYEDEWEENLP